MSAVITNIQNKTVLFQHYYWLYDENFSFLKYKNYCLKKKENPNPLRQSWRQLLAHLFILTFQLYAMEMTIMTIYNSHLKSEQKSLGLMLVTKCLAYSVLHFANSFCMLTDV